MNTIFGEAPLADLDTISLVHPRKYIEEIFNIPKTELLVEKEPYADTMLCPNSKNVILSLILLGV